MNSSGWPARGTTATPAPVELTAAALARNPSGSVTEYFFPLFAMIHIWRPSTPKLLAAGMGVELESEVADKGDSLAHSRIVPSEDPEAIIPLSELMATHVTGARCPRSGIALSRSDGVHSLTAASLEADAMNSPCGSKAMRQTIPDSSAP